MLRRSMLLVLMTAAMYVLQAQPIQAPSIYMKDDTLRGYELKSGQILFMEDSSGSLNLAEVQQQRNAMALWDTKKEVAKNKRHVFWFHYRVVNNMAVSNEAGITGAADYADVYVVRQNGQTDTFRTGNMIPWSRKKEFKRHNVVTFTLMPNDSADIFQRMEFKSTSTPVITPVVVKPEKFARKRFANMEEVTVPGVRVPTAFFMAMVILMGLIYVGFFLLVREKVFLFFGLFLLMLVIEPLAGLMEGFNREHPGALDYLGFVPVTFIFFFTQFYREYLRTKVHIPKWDKILNIFSYAFMVVAVMNYYLSRDDSKPTQIAIVTFPILMIITHFLLPGKMIKEKKVLLYTTLPFLALLAILIINDIFKLGLPVDIGIVFLLMFLWMVFSFSRVLVERFIQQRRRIRDHELELESIEKERELERLKLAEQQKHQLEIEVEQRTAELKRSLENLKATQNQLIQAEKMASLGEMTAGIAHEIQNPLNFVNNFAEVNNEITEEIRAEIEKLVTEDKRGELNALLNDLADNQSKIRFHGKRADSIVKNMLMHSRKGTSQKEPVNLNALVDEYTKLSFHGLRARDKSFNADFEVQADPSIKSVDLLQQDFGRVLLNLVNNAFYAVNEKAKSSAEDYKPKVTVKTSQSNDAIRIEVMDNGKGISDQNKEKIFQPFFTTKPTGEGTGLGLSLSYDIITKGHGGKISVDSKEGEGTRFIIDLPK